MRRHWWFVALGISCIVLIAAGFSVHHYYIDQAAREAMDDIRLLRSLRKEALQRYLQTRRSEVLLLSRYRKIEDIMDTFSNVWDEISTDKVSKLRKHFLDPDGGEGAGSEVVGTYILFHATIDPLMSRLADAEGYSDTYLIDPAGNLIYSRLKLDDFGINLLNGKWRDTAFGKAVGRLLENPEAESMAFIDFAPYAPAHDAAVAFFVSPIFRDDKLLGLFAFQITNQEINRIMQFSSGLGETGESYVVGDDLILRSNPRFSEDPATPQTLVESESVQLALEGISSTRSTTGRRGNSVFAAFGPLMFEGATWVVISEIEKDEALEPGRRRARETIIVVAVGMVIILAAALFLFVPRSDD